MNTQLVLSSFQAISNFPILPLRSIVIPSGNRHIVIPIEQLLYLEASGNYTYIYTSDGRRYLVSKTLKSYAAILSQRSFVRVHKSWLINLKYLQGFCECERSIVLRGGKEIAISRRRVREVCKIIAPLLLQYA